MTGECESNSWISRGQRRARGGDDAWAFEGCAQEQAAQAERAAPRCVWGVDENSENTVRTCCAPDANSMGLYP